MSVDDGECCEQKQPFTLQKDQRCVHLMIKLNGSYLTLYWKSHGISSGQTWLSRTHADVLHFQQPVLTMWNVCNAKQWQHQTGPSSLLWYVGRDALFSKRSNHYLFESDGLVCLCTAYMDVYLKITLFKAWWHAVYAPLFTQTMNCVSYGLKCLSCWYFSQVRWTITVSPIPSIMAYQISSYGTH